MDINPRFPEPQLLNCPRCDSTNTKFCYYNNYNLSQPRHYCKNCRRYWTKGGTLRNIPVGGATRKITKRSKRTSTSSLPPPPPPLPIPPQPPAAAVNLNLLSTTTTTTTTTSNNHITSNNRIDYPMGPFGNLLMEGLNFNLVSKSNNNNHDDDVLIRNPMIRNPIADDFRTNFLRLNDTSGTERGESSCWNGGETGWPDLSIFTPGSTFH